MKILHLADLHIGKRVNGFSMLEDQKYILEQILGIVKAQKTETVLIAGDVYDKAIPSAEAVEVFDDFLTKLVEAKQKVLLISGNHDSEERLAFASQVMKKSGVYFAPVFSGDIEKVTLQDECGDIHFYMLPYMKPTKAVENLKKLLNESDTTTLESATTSKRLTNNECEKINKTERNILLAHQFLTGATPSESEEFSVGGIENIDAQMFEDFDYVALGHIHRAQQVGKEYIRYAGTPLKYSFSEVNHKKSVTIVEIKEKGTVLAELVTLKPLRDMRELKGTYIELTARENYQDTDTNDYVHITLTDEEDIIDVIAKLRFIYPNLMKLDYDNTRTRSRQNICMEEQVEQKSPMGLFSDFYLQQNNQEMTKEQYEFAKQILEKISC